MSDIFVLNNVQLKKSLNNENNNEEFDYLYIHLDTNNV